jgi:membrane protein YdbS with pleckstrin-like domain
VKPVYMLLASRPLNQMQTPRRELSMLVVKMMAVHAACLLLFVMNIDWWEKAAGAMLILWVLMFSSMLYVCAEAKGWRRSKDDSIGSATGNAIQD